MEQILIFTCSLFIEAQTPSERDRLRLIAEKKEKVNPAATKEDILTFLHDVKQSGIYFSILWPFCCITKQN